MDNLAVDYDKYEIEYGTNSPIPTIQFLKNPDSISELNEEQILSYFHDPAQETEIKEITTTETTRLEEFRAPLIHISKKESPHSYSVALQRWQGYVIKVLDRALLVRLIDLTRKGPDEETIIPLEEFSPDDYDLVKIGAIFYWSIGYSTKSSGQRTRFSEVRFQRLPFWKREEIDAGKQEAMRLKKTIRWE